MFLKKFTYKKPFLLESGNQLPEIELAYSTFGQLNETGDNVIWVCHALTANSDVSDWWAGLFGAGKLLDPTKYFIVCANMLGSCYGSTNALSINPKSGEAYYHDFPLLTIRDIVSTLELLRKHLNIQKIHLCLGGSMGGQQVLEWAIMQPDLIENLFLIATNAFHSPWGVAFNESQRMAIEADQSWKERNEKAGLSGMKAARGVALLSYRNYETYMYSQSETAADKFDNFRASSYQQYQGDKLLKRFHAFAYWTLSKAMDSHNVGRGRENPEKALQKIRARALVVGIKTDILFPVSEQKFLAKHIPNAIYKEIESVYGHDGFLIENEKIDKLVQDFLQNEPVKFQTLVN